MRTVNTFKEGKIFSIKDYSAWSLCDFVAIKRITNQLNSVLLPQRHKDTKDFEEYLKLPINENQYIFNDCYIGPPSPSIKYSNLFRFSFRNGFKKLILFILLLTGADLSAQSAGNSGLSFLKLGFGARNIAMSDLGVVAANDLTSFNYNPSLIAVNQKTQLSFTHNSLFQDLSSEMFAGSFSIFNMPIAVGVNTTSVSDIEIRTKPGEPDAKFNAHFFSASISTARQISENLVGGVLIKYLYENLYTDDAAGIAFDFGLTYKGLLKGLSFGTSLRNLGNMNSLRLASTALPTDLRFGAAFEYPISEIKLDLTTVAGFQKYTKNYESHFHVGGEALYDNTFSLRLGYMSGYDLKSMTAGFGLRWKNLNLDYAYVPMKYGLGDSHIITFIYTFDQ